ncbi:site-specific integrase [Congregibacter variabilis]|uniref:Site-specific integrase n=1 Tax=Congregibacter variabilis TaxID=3081200 RepID=A0ABZ0I3F8_9GAMM|nr:site-specific integrase [Congregibacter sp. IMCC43200]
MSTARKTDYTKPFRFTKTSLSGVPPSNGKLAYYYDTKVPQLGVTRQVSGKLTYHVRAIVEGKTARVGIDNGTFPGMTPETAEKAALKMLDYIASGGNPVKDRKASRVKDELEDLTVEDALDAFCKGKLRRLRGGEKVPLKEGTKDNYRKTIKRLLGEKLYKGPLIKLTEAIIKKCVDDSATTVGATGCRSLSSVWNWTNKQQKYRGKLPPNPVKEYADYNEGLHVSPPKDRRLIHTKKNNEFPPFLAEVNKLEAVHKEAVLWLLLTGNRSGEAEGLEWSDIDWKSGEYTLRDTKNRITAKLPIPSTLVRPLRLRRKAEGRVFPVKTRIHVGKCAAAMGIKLSPHDLRRTHAGLCAEVLPGTSTKRLQNRVFNDVLDDYVGTSADLHEELAKVERTFYAHAEQPLDNVKHLEVVK